MLWSATNPEPPYTALHRLIRGEWWLPPTLVRTDEARRVRVRGFLGYYQLFTNTQQAPATANGNQVASGPINSRETPLRIAIARVAAASSTSTGWCGFANRLRWSTVWSRSNGQTLYDSTNSLYWIYCAGAWVPWDSSTPSI